MFGATESDGVQAIRMPSFGQWVKAGAGFTIGACFVGFFAAIAWWLFVVMAGLTLLSGFGRQTASTRVAPPPTSQRQAAPVESSHEERVQRAMQQQREIDEQIRAEREARKRLDASRR